MPKPTRPTKKYLAALELPVFNSVIVCDSYSDLYRQLNSLGYFWSTATQEWFFDDVKPLPTTKEIRIRITASATRVDSAARDIRRLMEGDGYQLTDPIRERGCLPPQQNVSKIYMVFEKA